MCRSLVTLKGTVVMGELEGPVTAEVLDAITEAVVKPSDPVVRAHVVAQLVEEIDAAIAWRHERDEDPLQEEASLHQVFEEASSHEKRMEAAADQDT